MALSSETDSLWSLHCGNALDAYSQWPAPDCIISDGAYGISGFAGDTSSPEGLPDWYEPHVAAWSRHAQPATTLWFWNTEVGWATVHPLLERYGWEYVQTIVWDKGVGHIAGNVNSQTIRQFPVVTEICALYQRPPTVQTPQGRIHLKEWLRSEWLRSGLPLYESNEACGVANAATRKYLTQDDVWYPPPSDMFDKLASYANRRGLPSGKPYFQLCENETKFMKLYEQLRYRWNHKHGLTNVWSVSSLRNSERYKVGSKPVHANQKPLSLMRRIVDAGTTEDDVVWEPFGGLCSASVAAEERGRRSFAAECNQDIARVAIRRLTNLVRPLPLD